MNTKMTNKIEYANLAIWSVLAAMGGITRFLTSRLSADAVPLSRQQLLFQLAANGAISWFAGIMAGMLFTAMGLDAHFAYGAAGVFGFMGAEGLKTLAEKYTTKV